MRLRFIQNTILSLMIFVFSLPVVLIVLFQIPYVQNFITKKVQNILTDQLNTHVEISKISYAFPYDIVVKNLYVEDYNLDTLFYLKKLKIRPFSLTFNNPTFRIKKIKIDEFKVKINVDSNDFSNLDYFLQNLPSSETSEDSSQTIVNLVIDNIDIKNSTFVYKKFDTLQPTEYFGFNPNDIKIDSFNLKINDLFYSSDSLSLFLENFSFKEKKNLQVKDLTFNLLYTNNQTVLQNFYLGFPHSFLKGELYLSYSDKASFEDFFNRVYISSSIEKVRINSDDFKNFFNPYANDSVVLEGSFDLSGYLSALTINNFDLKLGENSQLFLFGEAIGLPQTENLYLALEVPIFNFYSADLKKIVKIYNPQLADSLNYVLNKFEYVKINTFFSGLIKNFSTDLTIESDLGNAFAKFDFFTDTQKVVVNGLLNTQNINLGRILSNEDFGTFSLTDTFKITYFNKNKFKGQTRGKVGSFYYKKFNYNDFKIYANFSQSLFDGGFSISDTNITLNFIGRIDLAQEVKKIKFDLNVDTIQLYKLNLDTADRYAGVSFGIQADVNYLNIDNFYGKLFLSKRLNLTKNLQYFYVNNLQIKALEPKDSIDKNITFYTDFFDAKLSGNFSFKTISYYLQKTLANYFPLFFDLKNIDKHLKKNQNAYFQFYCNFYQPNKITDFIFPQLNLSKNTYLIADYNFQKNNLSLKFSSDTVNYSSVILKNLNFDLKNNDEAISFIVASEQIDVSKFKIKNFKTSLLGKDNSLKINLFYDNKTKIKNSADINGLISFFKENDNIFYKIKFGPDSLFIEDNVWLLSDISVDIDSLIKINNFVLIPDSSSSISISGNIGEEKNEKIFINIKNFNLSYLQHLISDTTELSGILDGYTKISNISKIPLFKLDFKIFNLIYNKVNLENFVVLSDWNSSDSIINFSIENYRQGKTKKFIIFQISGDFNPFIKSYNILVDLEKLKVKSLLELAGIKKDYLQGVLFGTLKINGIGENYNIKGEIENYFGKIKVEDIGFEMNINKKAVVLIDNHKIELKNVILLGPENQYDARLRGIVYHNNFKDFNFDFVFEMDSIDLINIPHSRKDLDFYGKLVTSGTVELKGTPNDVQILGKIITEDRTKFFINLNKPTKLAEETPFITFVSADSSKIKIQSKSQETEPKVEDAYNQSFTYEYNIDLKLRPDAKFTLIFDPTTGEYLEIQGTGDLNVSKKKYSDINVFGEITLVKGKYRLVLQDIFSKEFLIQKGSTIKWNGSPTDAEMDLTAIYQLKNVNLYDLLLDDNYWGEKTPVNCYIKMKGNLTSPEITFDFEILKADERLISQVKHLDQANKNLQFISLLTLGKFQPLPGLVYDPQQNINTSQLISSQINSLLSRFNNNLDLNINYEGNMSSMEQLDVAMSFNLFKERISVNTDIGVVNNSSNQNANNFIGDVEIEAKLNKKGNIRLKVFNKTNRYNLYEKGPYTQGIGLFFRYDFDKLFRRKNKK